MYVYYGLEYICESLVRIPGSDKDVVSDETSIGSLTKLGSPWVKACVIQNGRCSVVAGGLKGFL